MPGLTVPSDWGGSESAWGAGLQAFGAPMMKWGAILHQNARADAAEDERQKAISDAYAKLMDEPSGGEMGDAPPVYGPPEAPVQGPPEAGQMGVSQGPQRAEDRIASLRRQTLEGEALLAASAPELIDEYRAAAGERLRQAELERDSKLIAPVLSQVRAQFGPGNEVAEANINILVEGLRRGDFNVSEVRAGLLTLAQEHTQQLNQAALDNEFEAAVNALAVDPRFNMYGYRSGTHDQESYEAGAFGNVKLLGELTQITSDMPPAKRNQFYRAIAGAQSEGVAQVMIETQRENNALKTRERMTKAALGKIRAEQQMPEGWQGPPLSAAGQPAPSAPPVTGPTGAAPAAPATPGAPAGEAPAAAGVPLQEWRQANHFEESGMWSRHDSAMHVAQAQAELRENLGSVLTLDGTEQDRQAAVDRVITQWSRKYGVNPGTQAELRAFANEDLDTPSVEDRFDRAILGDVYQIANGRDLIERVEQAETVEQAVKDAGDLLVAGIVGAGGAATGDAEFQAYAAKRMRDNKTVRKVYEKAAEFVWENRSELSGIAEKAADAKAAVQGAVDSLTGYIEEIADRWSYVGKSMTEQGIGQRRLEAERSQRERDRAGRAERRATERDERDRLRDLEERLEEAGRLAQEQFPRGQRQTRRRGEPQLQGPTPEYYARRQREQVERNIDELRSLIGEARQEYRHVGSNRAELGRKLRTFMRMRQRYAAMADSGMLERDVVDALSNEIEQLRKLYQRGPKK